MLRMSVDGKEGVAFGLYTTTGRAVSFLAPWLFSAFIDMFGTDRAGMGGLSSSSRSASWPCWRCTRRTGTGALAQGGADRQADAGIRLDLDAVDGHRAGDLAAELMIVTLAESVCRAVQFDFLAPRQHDVELGLQQAAPVDVGNADRPAVAGDL